MMIERRDQLPRLHTYYQILKDVCFYLLFEASSLLANFRTRILHTQNQLTCQKNGDLSLLFIYIWRERGGERGRAREREKAGFTHTIYDSLTQERFLTTTRIALREREREREAEII